jgi:predicted MFS family arabinose efflux permease
VGSLAGASGALAVGLPSLAGLTPLQSYRTLLWAYAGTALILLGLFRSLSSCVEAGWDLDRHRSRDVGVRRSRRVVARLAALFALDTFAGGFVLQSLAAYCFSLRYGVDTSTLGGIFFGTNVLAAVSFLAAAPLAKRLGLLNTMVFTHLPSNVLLVLVPLMPTLPLAVAMLLARHLLSQLDVPTRQSYTMAVVDPDERAAAAGVMAVARNTAAALAPGMAGRCSPFRRWAFPSWSEVSRFYDLVMLVVFRGVQPPEEARPPTPALATHP